MFNSTSYCNMSMDCFNLKIDEIKAISDKAVKVPNLPIDVALQESEDLYIWCEDDKELLVKAGLNWQLVDDLPVRAGALRYIQSQWQKEYKSIEEARKEWRKRSPEAFELRNELLHHFLYAFYSFPDLYARTQKIAKGNTQAGMIQDLSDLSVLGEANSQQLFAIGFDITLLDKAILVSEEMAKLLAVLNSNGLEDYKFRILRDKAFIHLKEAVDEIRRCGQYVFWKDNQRRKGYISIHIKNSKHPKGKKGLG